MRPARILIGVLVPTGAVMALAGPAAADPPGAGIVREVLGGAAGWGFSAVTDGIAAWVMGAVGDLLGGVVDFLLTSARPELGAVWFSGPDSPFALVRNLAGVLLVGFVLLAVIHELVAGDLPGAVGRIARDCCVAVLGIAALVVVAVKLLDLTDALSAAVLGGADGASMRFLTDFGAVAHAATSGFTTVLLGLVLVVAALLVWIELLIRSALIYLLVALAPLAFAAMTWPAARGVLRRTLELLVAVIVSKFVICVAIAVGVAALGGIGEADPDAGAGTVAAAGTGALLSGGAILALAAFSPFIILKLIPFAEAAVVAHGVSRAPVRGAQSSASTVLTTQSLGRLAGGRTPTATGTGGASTAAANGARGASTTAGASAAGGGVAAAATAAGRVATGAARRVEGRADRQGSPDRPPRPPAPKPGRTPPRDVSGSTRGPAA